MSDEAKQVTRRTKEYAMEVEKKLLEVHETDLNTRWREAELIYEVIDKALWQVRGYESRSLYREFLNIARSTWHEREKVWRVWAIPALKDDKITRPQFKRLQWQNVKQIMRFNDKRMFEKRWIEKALNMKEADLTAQIDSVLSGEPEETLGGKESRTVFKVPCTESQKTFFFETLKTFQEAHKEELPDPENTAAILESLMAEVRSGL